MFDLDLRKINARRTRSCSVKYKQRIINKEREVGCLSFPNLTNLIKPYEKQIHL